MTEHSSTPPEWRHGPSRKHDTKLAMAAATLLRDGYVRAVDAVYHMFCSCGQIRRNTRLAASIHTLRSRGWDIETEWPDRRALATYRLRHAPDSDLAPAPAVFECLGCGKVKLETALSSKYGVPQLVGEIKGRRLLGATCAACAKKRMKGTMEAIWRQR